MEIRSRQKKRGKEGCDAGREDVKKEEGHALPDRAKSAGATSSDGHSSVSETRCEKGRRAGDRMASLVNERCVEARREYARRMNFSTLKEGGMKSRRAPPGPPYMLRC